MEPVTSQRRLRRPLVGVLLVLVLVYGLLLAAQGLLAAKAAGRAHTHQADVVRALAAGDLPAAQRSVRLLGDETARARGLLAGPQWALPETIPLVGDDLRAVRVSVRALDDVVHRAAIPVVDVAASLRDSDGRLDFAALPRLDPALTEAARQAAQSQRQVGAIRPSGLIGPLRGPVVQAQQALTQLATMTARTRDGLRVAGAVLGTGVPSSTLFGVQNPAEARGSGGIVGAWATLRADGGKVAITSIGVNDQLFGYRAAPELVPPDVLATYGQDIRHVANVTMTPAFPVAARLLRSSYQAYARATPGAVRLDDEAGVVTLTPHGLSLLIGATAPVRLPTQGLTVTQQNAAALFENGIYTLVPDDGQRNLLIQQVLREVFAALQAPRTDPLRLAQAAGAAVASGDLRVWDPDPVVQAAADGVGASGALGRPDGQQARVTLVSADAAKLDFYLQERVVLDRPARTLTVTLENRAPKTVAPYVAVQYPDPGEPLTGHDVVVQIHLPPTVGVERVDRDGRRVAVAASTESGWNVVRLGTRITRGSATTLRYRLSGTVPGVGHLVTQPLSNPPTVTIR